MGNLYKIQLPYYCNVHLQNYGRAYLAADACNAEKQVKSEYIDTRYLTGFEIPGSRDIQDVLLFMIKF
jgi:hypothetical protein